MIRTSLLAVLLVLGGCASYNPPYVVPAPSSGAFVEKYEFKQGFNGVECGIGLPILGWIPVIGEHLKEVISFRAGVRQDVLVPVMKEYSHAQVSQPVVGVPSVAAPGGVQLRECPRARHGGGDGPGLRR